MTTSFWSDFTPATCMPDGCFCEAVGHGLIRQPSNTWSNLGFCLVGAFMALEWARQKNAGGLRSVEAVLFALAVFLVGVTSGLYHASLTFFGQTLDVQSMYLVVLLAFAVNLDALLGSRRAVPLYVGLNVVLGVLLVTVPVFRRWAFALVIVAILVTEVLLRVRGRRTWPVRLLLATVAVQGLAFAIWALDTLRLVCDPHGLVQGHAVWHLLGAVATFLLWRYYRQPAAAPALTS
ncbi:MAG: ceramidase domain-containing protein [Myxococcaceae bacterium]|nr:ceramidase domain-containing protein [Myxococcaceae bacterium]